MGSKQEHSGGEMQTIISIQAVEKQLEMHFEAVPAIGQGVDQYMSRQRKSEADAIMGGPHGA